ncbi:hypothetical protein CLF_107862 [Clonorchis sinensis]|uniref:Bcl-2 Bcl-2 homology region 1-3 domain-containing protein n=1 Tax=Clonorchis sinensis TaxID=79923 RepID=G7YHA1_CLOSI|nr:hypothetical protein CLF_107862 [Clonorchis sinensis]
MIRRTFSRITRTDFQILYGAYVRPLLEYANPVVYSGRTKDVILIERVQRAATKMVDGLKSLDYETHLVLLDLFPLEYRRLRGDLILTYALFEQGLANRLYSTFVYPLANRKSNRPKKCPYGGTSPQPRQPFRDCSDTEVCQQNDGTALSYLVVWHIRNYSFHTLDHPNSRSLNPICKYEQTAYLSPTTSEKSLGIKSAKVRLSTDQQRRYLKMLNRTDAQNSSTVCPGNMCVRIFCSKKDLLNAAHQEGPTLSGRTSVLIKTTSKIQVLMYSLDLRLFLRNYYARLHNSDTTRSVLDPDPKTEQATLTVTGSSRRGRQHVRKPVDESKGFDRVNNSRTTVDQTCGGCASVGSGDSAGKPRKNVPSYPFRKSLVVRHIYSAVQQLSRQNRFPVRRKMFLPEYSRSLSKKALSKTNVFGVSSLGRWMFLCMLTTDVFGALPESGVNTGSAMLKYVEWYSGDETCHVNEVLKWVIIDYVYYRICLRGYNGITLFETDRGKTHKHVVLDLILRRLVERAEELEVKLKPRFENRKAMLLSTPERAQLDFMDTLENIWADGLANWGRFLVYITFTAAYCISCLDCGMVLLITTLVEHAINDLDAKMGKWLLAHGGWRGLLRAANDVRLN